MTYSFNAFGYLVRDADGAAIPADPTNADYADYLAWCAAGNTATPYVEPLPALVAGLADSVDNIVANIYSTFTRFQQEYLLREAAAQAFKTAGYAGDPGTWVSAFATAAGMTNQAAADLILTQATNLNGALATLGALRMRKYEILGAADAATANAKFADITSQIQAVAAQLS